MKTRSKQFGKPKFMNPRPNSNPTDNKTWDFSFFFFFFFSRTSSFSARNIQPPHGLQVTFTQQNIVWNSVIFSKKSTTLQVFRDPWLPLLLLHIRRPVAFILLLSQILLCFFLWLSISIRDLHCSATYLHRFTDPRYKSLVLKFLLFSIQSRYDFASILFLGFDCTWTSSTLSCFTEFKLISRAEFDCSCALCFTNLRMMPHFFVLCIFVAFITLLLYSASG